jgi:hypothetical protein
MDAPHSPVVDSHAADAAHGGASPFDHEDTPDAADQQSPTSDDVEDHPSKPATLPMQKRRRVTRAWYAPDSGHSRCGV